MFVMSSLTDQQIIEYYHRCYKAVDGLWFMKVEAKFDFEIALELDKQVWSILPKIQARMIKSMLKLGKGEDTLLESLKTKLSLEGFDFKVEPTRDGFQIRVIDCPWHSLMVKSGRENLSEKVGTTICNIEYRVWISEFDEKMCFELKKQQCKGFKDCILEFKRC
jgi:hypothetical protein